MKKQKRSNIPKPLRPKHYALGSVVTPYDIPLLPVLWHRIDMDSPLYRFLHTSWAKALVVSNVDIEFYHGTN